MKGTRGDFSSPSVEVGVESIGGMLSRMSDSVFSVSSGASAEAGSKKAQETTRYIPMVRMDKRSRGVCERIGFSTSSENFSTLMDTRCFAKRQDLVTSLLASFRNETQQEKKDPGSGPGPFSKG
jgi:hypothetical protein